jgi:hypothetical protein
MEGNYGVGCLFAGWCCHSGALARGWFDGHAVVRPVKAGRGALAWSPALALVTAHGPLDLHMVVRLEVEVEDECFGSSLAAVLSLAMATG